MNPYNRAARFVLRLLAFGLIVSSLMLLCAHLFEAQIRPPASTKTAEEAGQVSKWKITMEAIPLAIGLVIFFQSSRIARGLTSRFDE